MVSDVLSAAVSDIDEYLAVEPPIYTGHVGWRLKRLRDEMEAMRIMLDTPPHRLPEGSF